MIWITLHEIRRYARKFSLLAERPFKSHPDGMSIFGGRTPQTPAAGFSVVDDRLTIRGNIDTDGTVRVDGRVEGSSHRAGTLIVGVGGLVIGHVEAREVVVA